MVNAKAISLMLGASLAAAALSPAAARGQRLAYASVLEQDAAPVTATLPTPGSAARVLPARVPAAARQWPVERASQLLGVVRGIGAEGLDPDDYRPDLLSAALAEGEGARLDAVASAVFGWLAADLRDGRTPLADRRDYLMADPDAGLMPTADLQQRALAGGDVAGVLAGLAPAHQDYAALRSALAAEQDPARRQLIRANMDRWRWLPRELGGINVLVNVPEYMVRLRMNGQVANTYRAVVGRPGRNATPQLSEMIEGVIINPTWTVPQSIVQGEGLGGRVLGNPAWAQSMGYTATRSGGSISVVQQPGPRNALGQMKLDMPNEWAIFLHDTPSRSLFAQPNRALSHGCVRVERALEFAMTISLLGGGANIQQATGYVDSGRYTRVPLQRQIPVYIAYFTLGVAEDGQLAEFRDIYGRDAPVLASFARNASHSI